MKKMVLVSVGAAVLLFTGCSQKNPSVDMTTKNQKIEKVSSPSSNAVNTSGMNSNNMGENNTSNNVTSENTVKNLIADYESKLVSVHFNFDKYNIKDDQKPVVESDSTILNNDKIQKLSIKLEGNCDEWGSDEYNYALGLKRAKTIKDALNTQGIADSRMMIISYGKSNPVCTAHVKSCWAKNRRVDFKLLP